MDSRNRYHLCAVFLIEVFKVRQVLEVVCVNFAAVNNIVRLNIIGKFLNVKRYILISAWGVGEAATVILVPESLL